MNIFDARDNLNAMVLNHEQQIKDLAMHLLELKQLVTPKMTPKDEATPLVRLLRIMGTFDIATGHASTMSEALDSLESELRDVLGHYRSRDKG